MLFYTYTTLGVPIKCTDLTEWLLPMAPSLSYQNQEYPNSYELGRRLNHCPYCPAQKIRVEAKAQQIPPQLLLQVNDR